MSASANVTLKIVSPNEFYSCLISVSTSSPLELVLDESKRKLSQHLQSGVPYTLSHRNNRSKSLQHLDMKSPIYKYNFTHGDKLILLPVTKSSDINVASPGLVSVVLSLATPSTTTTTTTTSKLDNGNNASAPKESLRLGPISFESGTSFGTIIYTFYTTHSDQFPNVTSQKSSIAIHPCLSYKYDGEVSESHLIGYDQISANFLNMKKGRLLLKLSFIPSKSSRIDDISRYKKFMEDFSNQSTREASFNTTDIETIRLDSHIVCTNNQLQPNAPVDEAKIDNCEINSIDNFVPSSECKNDIRTSQAKDLKIVESTSVLNQISAVETAIMDHKEGPDDSKAMLTNDSKMRNRNITIKRLLHESPPQIEQLDDSFYDPTPSDLQYMQSSLKKSLQDTPLVSKVALESKKLETLRLKYPSCRIRFRLSTNLAVDATFSSEEPLQNLDQFVREWLRPPLSEASYTLSIGSALIEPMASTSLLVAGLAPSSILIVTFNPRVLEFSHLAPFETNVSTDENTASDMKNMRTEDTGTKDDKNKKNGGLMKKIFKKPGWLKI